MTDSRLHTLIARTARSGDLLGQEIAIQEQLRNLVLPLPFLPASKTLASAGHSALVSAIISRDGEKARQELIAHVESTYAWCMSVLHATTGPTSQ